jgi:hypothetical protein
MKEKNNVRLGARPLASRVAEAEQKLELARKKAQQAKLEFKRARKAFKQAKKRAKLIRKAAKKAVKRLGALKPAKTKILKGKKKQPQKAAAVSSSRKIPMTKALQPADSSSPTGV